MDQEYTVCYMDDSGHEHTHIAESLQGLAEGLHLDGYEGQSIKVVDERGFLVGWVRSRFFTYN